MEDCIFCKIAEGRASCHKVYEDENFLGFLDTYPRNKGHVLVIPKNHYRWTYDVPNFGEYWEAAKKVAIAMQKTLGSEWIMFLTFGWQVPHAHLHVIPRYKEDAGEELPPVKKGMFTDNEMKEVAEKILKQVQVDQSSGKKL